MAASDRTRLTSLLTKDIKDSKETDAQLLDFVAQTSVLSVAIMPVLLLWAHKTRFGNQKLSICLFVLLLLILTVYKFLRFLVFLLR